MYLPREHLKPRELSQLVEAAPNEHTTTQVSKFNGESRKPTLLEIRLTGIVTMRTRIIDTLANYK